MTLQITGTGTRSYCRLAKICVMTNKVLKLAIRFMSYTYKLFTSRHNALHLYPHYKIYRSGPASIVIFLETATQYVIPLILQSKITVHLLLRILLFTLTKLKLLFFLFLYSINYGVMNIKYRRE